MSEENQHWIFEPKSYQKHFFVSHWKRIYISREPYYDHNSNANNNDHDSNNTTTPATINNNVQLGLDLINLISKHSLPVPLGRWGLHCDCNELHFMTNIKHEHSTKRRLKHTTNGTTMNEETIHKEGTMIYMDSLNPDIPIKLEHVDGNLCFNRSIF